jgi:hypothetical protein
LLTGLVHFFQAVKTIRAFNKRIKACHFHKSKGLKREPNDTGGPDLDTKIAELQVKAKLQAREMRFPQSSQYLLNVSNKNEAVPFNRTRNKTGKLLEKLPPIVDTIKKEVVGVIYLFLVVKSAG